jgi:hypothetical protein
VGAEQRLRPSAIYLYCPRLLDETVGVQRSWEDTFKYTLKIYPRNTHRRRCHDPVGRRRVRLPDRRCRTCLCGSGMIVPSNRVRIMVATSLSISARVTTGWQRWLRTNCARTFHGDGLRIPITQGGSPEADLLGWQWSDDGLNGQSELSCHHVPERTCTKLPSAVSMAGP